MKIIRLITFLLFGLYLAPVFATNSPLEIKDFETKQYITDNGKLAIIVLDSLKNVDESINGTFRFLINSFSHDLRFNDGVSVIPQVVESSTFILLKHQSQSSSIGKYYYILKKGNKLKTIEINGLTLLLIPVVLLFIAYIFKRFLLTFVIIGLCFAYFYFSKGLDFGQLLESVILSIQKLL